MRGRPIVRGEKELIAEESGFTANSNGNVFDKDGNEVVQSFDVNGYCTFRAAGRTVMVHRFVWRCFNGPIPSNQVVDHINRLKSDPRLENLRCVSQGQNNSNRGFPITKTRRI